MELFDYFGNKIEVGDTVSCIDHMGDTYDLVVISLDDPDKGIRCFLSGRDLDNGEVCVMDSYKCTFYLDVTKKDKEGAMTYHLLNSQIDGGS